MTPDELAIIRRAYAMQVTAAAGVSDARVEGAFAAIRREDFLGPGPWPILRHRRRYVPTPSADPVYLYTNDLIGIVPEQSLNNGEPSLHAWLVAQAEPQPGEHAVHVGCGVGYYSAILAHLVGDHGRVTAIEFEPALAERARANFAGWPNVTVLQGDGTAVAFPPADLIYVNAGATQPAENWLDRLNDGGRLVLPLTTDKGFMAGDGSEMRRRGAVFLITRRGAEFQARWISPVAIYPCAGLRDEAAEKVLAHAFENGDPRRVRRLHRHDQLPDDRCWLRSPGFSLSYD
jgi:protein-L-isoaspartate(D-aspartate) O-methyltransferase